MPGFELFLMWCTRHDVVADYRCRGQKGHSDLGRLCRKESNAANESSKVTPRTLLIQANILKIWGN